MDSNFSLLDRFNNWMKESVMVKLASIGILMLILLIPSAWVEQLINERQTRADEVTREISAKWAASQTLVGPILMIPYKKIETVKEWTGAIQTTRLVESFHKAYFLPDETTANGVVSPEKLHRGIFDVAVYDSKVSIQSKFGEASFKKWNIPDEQIQWADAKLLIGISDLQGVHENPAIKIDGKAVTSQSMADIGLVNEVRHPDASNNNDYAYADNNYTMGIAVPLEWSSRADMLKAVSIELALKGSESLYFVPAAKTTSVSISGNWDAPSFDGKMLPTSRDLSPTAFKATWKILSFNRPLADQWVDGEQTLNSTEFGVRLLIPADQYQKSTRTAKYDVLIILLAFMALFLVEITKKVRIHPFQYILVGVALTVYYTLLLSISEHLGYNAAYAISSVATITLLTLYSTTFLRSKQLVFLFTLVMSLFYVFIFVIIQAEDLSLLIGSLGLFVIIAVVMYFSRNIQWYKDTHPPVPPSSISNS